MGPGPSPFTGTLWYIFTNNNTLIDSLLTAFKYRFETENARILNLKGTTPKCGNNVDVSKILGAALFFTTDLPGAFNELEGQMKTWNVIYGKKNR